MQQASAEENYLLKRKRENQSPEPSSDVKDQTLSGGEHQVDKQMEPHVKKIKTEYDLKATIIDEDCFPSNGSKLYLDDDDTLIEDIWQVKHVRKIMLDIVEADLKIWNESEEKILLDELIDRREEIETISLFLADSMIKRVTIHDIKYITEMIKNVNGAKALSVEEGFTDECLPSVHGSNTLNHWIKYMLPEIVKKQNELNLIESNEDTNEKLNMEEKEEKVQLLNSMQYDEKEEDGYAFLLDACNLADPLEIKKQIDEEEDACEEAEEIMDDYIMDTLFNDYIFNRTLPDEIGEYIINPFKEILTDAASCQEDNPYLSILEKTIRMFTSESKEEHHDLRVSPMRLGISLLILDCLNRELSLALNRGTLFYVIARPIVRAVLDNFIDLDPKKVYFKQAPAMVELNGRVFAEYVDSELAKEQIRQLTNVFDIAKPNFSSEEYGFEIDESDEESSDDSDIIDETDEEFENSEMFEEWGERAREQFVQPRYENFQYASCGGNTNVRLNGLIEHPLWNNFSLSQRNIALLNLHQLNSYNPVPLTFESTNNWLYTEEKLDEGEVQIPLHEQKIVSLFPNDSEELKVIPYVEHLIHFNSDIQYQPPTQDSIHIDINRIFRRAGNLSYSSSALVEGFLSLKSFISRIIKTLMVIKKDDLVTKLDIADAMNICDFTLYPSLQMTEPTEPKFVPYEAPPFTTEPVINTPAYLEDAVVEDINLFMVSNGKDREETTIPLKSDYDYVVNNSTFADHITLFLNGSLYNDSFIEVDGHRIYVYTPILKHRCPKMYEDYFSTPEKRIQGMTLTRNGFTFDMVFHWIESYYLGSFQPMAQEEDDENDEIIEGLIKDYVISCNGVQKSVFDYFKNYPEELEDGKEYELDVLDPPNQCFTLHQLYKDDETKDFQLIFIDHSTMEKKTRKVHKYILACRSPFFRQLFEGNYTDRVTDNFDIGDIFKDEQSIDAFLYYLYHNFIVLPTLSASEFEPLLMDDFTIEDVFSEEETPKNQDSIQDEENEINLYLALFVSSDYLMIDGLKHLCENVIGSLVDEENVVQILEFANEHFSETIFSHADNFLLSSSLILEKPHIINQDISLYYNYLSGPITKDNVAERIKLTIELADKSDSQLFTYHSERLENFHIPQLEAFILGNYEHFAQQECFYQPFKEIKRSEDQSIWEYISSKYYEMNSRF